MNFIRRPGRRFIPHAFLLPLFIALAGCDVIPPPQSDATRFYVLSEPGLTGETGIATRGLRLGLKDVELAGYLKTRSMVVRIGTNEIVMEDYRRWAEPLGEGIARLVRARLFADPAVAQVSLQPFAFDADRDYDIAITILHCEGVTDADGHGAARFAAVIEITTAGTNPVFVAHRVFTAPDAPWDGRDFSQLAASLGEASAALGQEIASLLPPISGLRRSVEGPSPRSPGN